MTMNKREYFINFSTVTDKDSLHRKLAACLPLPEYYGHNLDALFDCLTDLGPCIITLSGSRWLDSLGSTGTALRQVFTDAAEENKNLTFIWDN